MTAKTNIDKEFTEARENVMDAAEDNLVNSVNGHPDTGSSAISAVNVLVYRDGTVTTRVAGLIGKVTLFGALVEAILSLHELDRANQQSKIAAIVDALAEKQFTADRTDN